MDTSRKLVTIRKACEIADVKKRTVYNWMAAGKVEFTRTAGGCVRIFEDTLFRSTERETPHSSTVAAQQRRVAAGRT